MRVEDGRRTGEGIHWATEEEVAPLVEMDSKSILDEMSCVWSLKQLRRWAGIWLVGKKLAVACMVFASHVMKSSETIAVAPLVPVQACAARITLRARSCLGRQSDELSAA